MTLFIGLIFMVEKVAQHSHCNVCGKAVPLEEAQCSEDCKQKFRAMMKKRKMLVYLMYGLIGVIFILFLFSGGGL